MPDALLPRYLIDLDEKLCPILSVGSSHRTNKMLTFILSPLFTLQTLFFLILSSLCLTSVPLLVIFQFMSSIRALYVRLNSLNERLIWKYHVTSKVKWIHWSYQFEYAAWSVIQCLGVTYTCNILSLTGTDRKSFTFYYHFVCNPLSFGRPTFPFALSTMYDTSTSTSHRYWNWNKLQRVRKISLFFPIVQHMRTFQLLRPRRDSTLTEAI